MAKLIDMFNQFRQWCSWPKFWKTLGFFSLIGGMVAMILQCYSAKQGVLLIILVVITMALVYSWLHLGACTAQKLESLKAEVDGWNYGVTSSLMFILGVVGSVLVVWFDKNPTIADPLLFLGLSLSWLCVLRLIRPATDYNVLGFLLTAVSVRAVKLYGFKKWPVYLFFTYSGLTGVLRYFLESRDAAVQVQG